MSTAILTGVLVDDGGEVCTCGFQWGLTALYGNVTGTQLLITGEVLLQTLLGLLPLTNYFYRAFATNSVGTAYGAGLGFSTPPGPGPPLGTNFTEVITLAATDIRETSATINGLLANDDRYVCSVWFEWGSTSAYGSKTPEQPGATTGTAFSAGITCGEGKAIHFRAVAFNVKGAVYGSDMSFGSLSYLGPVTAALLEDMIMDQED